MSTITNVPDGWVRPQLVNYTGGRLKAKNISEEPILRLLLDCEGHWTMRFFDTISPFLSIRLAFPEATDELPDQFMLAKMQRLIDRGLVNGCCCGCRGDFEITKKGKAYYHDKYLAKEI